MPDTPRRRQEDHEIPVDAALVHVLDSRQDAERQREWERAEHWKDRRRHLVAYLVLVAAVIFLFWRQAEAMDRIEHEAAVRAIELASEAQDRADDLARQSAVADYEVCMEVNAVKDAISTFLADAYLADRDGISAGEQRILDLAATKFSPTECPPNPEAG